MCTFMLFAPTCFGSRPPSLRGIVSINIIRQQLCPDRPVSTSSNIPLKGLPSRLRPFGLLFSIIFDISLLFILLHIVVNWSLDYGSFRLMFPDGNT